MEKSNNTCIDIESSYKEFKDELRKYSLLESVYVIWCYSRNLTFHRPFPQDIELPIDFNPSSNIELRKIKGIPEFEQDFLIKEIILNCTQLYTGHTLRRVANLSKLVNILRLVLREEVSKNLVTETDLLVELNRMLHNQQKWQHHNQNTIMRYYKVFGYDELNKMVQEKLGITTKELIIAGFYLFFESGKQFINPYPILDSFSNKILSKNVFEVIFKHYAISIEAAKEELEKHQKINENILYTYNPLNATPILLYDRGFICPMPYLLFEQIVRGIYYLIRENKNFANSFGAAFQEYIGEVINKSVNSENIKVLGEEKFGKQVKQTADWIIIDNNSILFIECKTKRMTVDSKTEFDIKNGLESDLRKMAEFITQLYKTYVDYTQNKYPHVPFDNKKFFFPLVITFEEWYVRHNLFMQPLLKKIVIENFTKINLDTSLLDKYPYHVRSSQEFERDIQLINNLGIKNYFERNEKNDLFDYSKSFPYEDVFKQEFIEIFQAPFK